MEKPELKSMNDRIYDEFYIQQLESRLETDPLMAGGLLDFMSVNAQTSPGAEVYCWIDLECGDGFSMCIPN